MKRMSLEEIQQEELRVLKEFITYCDENGLRYTMYAGSLLGAVRHQGIIPWDDDIDVAMPREDYDKFITSYKSNKDFELLHYTKKKNCPYVMAKLLSKRTYVYEPELQEKYRLDYLGVWVDIFPIDYVSRKEKLNLFPILDKFLSCKILKFKLRKESNLFTKIAKCIVTPIMKIVPLNWYVKTLDDMASRGGHCNCIANLVWQPFDGSVDIKIWDSIVKYKFNNLKVDGWSDDKYLKKAYGDYMQLPPEEQRVPGHMVAYYRD